MRIPRQYQHYIRPPIKHLLRCEDRRMAPRQLLAQILHCGIAHVGQQIGLAPGVVEKRAPLAAAPWWAATLLTARFCQLRVGTPCVWQDIDDYWDGTPTHD